MKTLFILPDLFRAEGGIARIMRLYLRAAGELARPGDQVGYVALLDHGNPRDRARELVGPSLSHTNSCGGNYFCFVARTILRALESDRIICAHLHFAPLVWFASFLRPRLNYHIVAHGIEVWRPYGFWERLALGRARTILCISEYTRRQVLRFAPDLDPRCLVVLPNTFDPALAAGRDEPTKVEAGPPRLLVVSRLSSTDPYKGADLMIESLPRLLTEFPGLTLRIVGTGDDRPRLEVIAHRVGVEKAVVFLGAIDDAALRDEYRRCDVFTLPSRKEGFGLVYLEAMSWGKPCLAARAGGAPEVVGDPADSATPLTTSGTTRVGALVEYGNVEEIAVAVAEMLRNPRDPAIVRAATEPFAYPRFVVQLQTFLAREPRD